jgi:O-antigen biosynthesis protein
MNDSPVRLSLCMIGRDNCETLRPCLESIRPWVDEIIFVDTGSVDETPQIAAEFGAKLFEFPWCDDFSAARNVSLEHATGEWVFWMDTDDTIPEDAGRRLREIALGPHADHVLAYTAEVRCLGRFEGEMTVVDHVKLFRNLPELKFEFRVHEQLLPSIRRLGGEIVWSDIYVEHHGSNLEGDAQDAKCARDLRILGLELEERPEHPFALFNFGMTYADMNDHEQAVDYLQRSLAVSQNEDSHVAKALAILVGSLCSLKRWDEALTVCESGLVHAPHDAELSFRRGIILHELGHLQEAKSQYGDVLLRERPRELASVDPGILGYKAKHNLALVHRDLGEPHTATAYYRDALYEKPAYVPTRRALIEHLLSYIGPTVIRHEIQVLSDTAHGAADAMALLALLYLREGLHEQACQTIKEATQAYPDDDFVSDTAARIYFEHGTLEEARHAIESILQRLPDDAAALHNLAALQIREGELDAALESLERSLQIRPDSPPTQRLRDDVLMQLATVET